MPSEKEKRIRERQLQWNVQSSLHSDNGCMEFVAEILSIGHISVLGHGVPAEYESRSET